MQSKEEAREKSEKFSQRHADLASEFVGLSLDEQLQHFVSAVTMTSDELEMRRTLLNDLMRVLQPTYPGVILHPFGSFISKLGDKDSDLDIVVDVFASGCGAPDNVTKNEIFETVFRIIRKHSRRELPIFRNSLRIYARVPIIKFIHNSTGVYSDLSFENLLSVRNSQLIMFLSDLDPRVFPFLCLVRYWARFHQLTDSTKIKNYGLALLSLVYLTRKKILPSIHKLQTWDSTVPQCRIDGWNAAFYSKKKNVLKYLKKQASPPLELNEHGEPTTESILKMLLEFFELFGHEFQSDSFVVCSLTGEFIPRQHFVSGEEDGLPSELNDYKEYSKYPPSQRRLLSVTPNMPLVIQDPFALNFNVSAVTREPILQSFIAACQATVCRIEEMLKNRDEPLNLMDLFCEADPVESEAKAEKRERKRQRRLQRKQELQTAMSGDSSRLENQTAKYVDIMLGTTQPTAPSTNPGPPLLKLRFDLIPSETYKNNFHKMFYDAIQTEERLSSDQVIRKGKILWLTFMTQYVEDFFKKCYGLSVKILIIEEKQHNEPRISSPLVEKEGRRNPFGSTPPQGQELNYPNPFLATVPLGETSKGNKRQLSSPNPQSSTPKYARVTGEDASDSSAFSPTLNPNHKILSISEDNYKSILLIFKCSGGKLFREMEKSAPARQLAALFDRGFTVMESEEKDRSIQFQCKFTFRPSPKLFVVHIELEEESFNGRQGRSSEAIKILRERMKEFQEPYVLHRFNQWVGGEDAPKITPVPPPPSFPTSVFAQPLRAKGRGSGPLLRPPFLHPCHNRLRLPYLQIPPSQFNTF